MVCTLRCGLLRRSLASEEFRSGETESRRMAVPAVCVRGIGMIARLLVGPCVLTGAACPRLVQLQVERSDQ